MILQAHGGHLTVYSFPCQILDGINTLEIYRSKPEGVQSLLMYFPRLLRFFTAYANYSVMAQVRHRLFGKLAVATGFLTESQLKEALEEQQKSRFRGEDVPRLGKILEDKGYMTRRQIRKILKTARRMGGRRFGEIAMNLHLITLNQLNVARDVQEKLQHPDRNIPLEGSTKVVYERLRNRMNENGQVPQIGEILVELGFLSERQLDVILQHKNQISGSCPRCQSEFDISTYENGDQCFCPQCSASLRVLQKNGTLELGLEQTASEKQLKDVDKLERTENAGYRFQRQVGRDTMGVLYRGTTVDKEQPVALKVLYRKRSRDENVMAFLEEKVQKRKTLDHSSVRRLIDFERSDTLDFLVLEWIEGSSLRRVIEDRGALPQEKALSMVRRAIDGLQEAIDMNLFHGDLRPSNMLLARSGVFKLLNLGLTYQSSEHLLEILDSGRVAPFYTAPEFILDDREMTERSEIYSLGACFYHMVTGEPPFRGSSPYTVIRRALEKGIRPPDEIKPFLSRSLSEVITRMIAIEPDKRFSNYDRVLEALDSVELQES